ncbi:MAG: DUF5606 domain-containing protein [Bacteroidota bacterium]
MNLEDYVAVSGLPGIFKLAANRSNGLIVEDLDNGKKRFVSARKHQFTPLASIGIYTITDTEELKVIFKTMFDQIGENPPPPVNAAVADILGYFEKILPTFDRDRVYVSDIKKVIKWFNFLYERQLLNFTESEAAEAVASTEEE